MNTKVVTAIVMLGLVNGCRASTPGLESGAPDAEEAQVSAFVADDPTARAIDTFVSRLVPFGYSGGILVSRGERLLVDKGYGLAHDATRRPNTRNTVHSVGSVTKQFTAAAILALEEEGLLRTDDTLDRFFDDVPEDKRKVTLHHLLTHSAGIINFTGDDYEAASREQMVGTAFAAKLLFEPGSSFQYSNAGYGLLAAVVEIASGQPYEQYVRARLFDRAGLLHSGYRRAEWGTMTVAHAYAGGRDNGANPGRSGFPSWNVLGNGELMSTTGDLHRWHRALNGTSVLSAASKKKLYTPFLRDYAYGWDVEETGHGRRISHTGGSDMGTGLDYRRYSASGSVVVAFSNRDADRILFASGLGDKLESLLFEQTVAMPPEVGDPSGVDIASFAGDWAVGDTAARIVIEGGDRMMARAQGRAAVSVLIYGTPA